MEGRPTFLQDHLTPSNTHIGDTPLNAASRDERKKIRGSNAVEILVLPPTRLVRLPQG